MGGCDYFERVFAPMLSRWSVSLPQDANGRSRRSVRYRERPVVAAYLSVEMHGDTNVDGYFRESIMDDRVAFFP